MKLSDLRSDEVESAMGRSLRWEQSQHHVDFDTGAGVPNCDIEPVNANRAAHDRMILREYALKLERQVGMLSEVDELRQDVIDKARWWRDHDGAPGKKLIAALYRLDEVGG
jgi:hypothetical protein